MIQSNLYKYVYICCRIVYMLQDSQFILHWGYLINNFLQSLKGGVDNPAMLSDDIVPKKSVIAFLILDNIGRISSTFLIRICVLMYVYEISPFIVYKPLK